MRKGKIMALIMGTIVILISLLIICIVAFKTFDATKEDTTMYPGEIVGYDVDYDNTWLDDLQYDYDIPDYVDPPKEYILSELIPFDDEMQIFIQDKCEEYGVDYAYVLAIIDSESSFRDDIGYEKILGGQAGGARYYGYMQLSKENCKIAETDYGLDAHTPKGNIEMGINLIGIYYNRYLDYDMVTKCYKSGENAALGMKGSPKYVGQINSLYGYYTDLLYPAPNRTIVEEE